MTRDPRQRDAGPSLWRAVALFVLALAGPAFIAGSVQADAADMIVGRPQPAHAEYASPELAGPRLPHHEPSRPETPDVALPHFELSHPADGRAVATVRFRMFQPRDRSRASGAFTGLIARHSTRW